MKNFFIITSILILIGIGTHFVYGRMQQNTFDTAKIILPEEPAILDTEPSVEIVNDSQITPLTVSAEPVIEEPIILDTPKPLKAFYISSWVTATPRIFNPIIDFIKTSDINAVIIDIKDDTGRISFLTNDPLITELGSAENRIRNIRSIIRELNRNNIYVIGRVSVFQDPYMTTKKPDWAIVRKSDGDIWKDRKGLSFLDPANNEVWDYTVAIARASFDVGFDEINFDYIRYPSDGNISDINYKLQDGETRADHLKSFFAYLDESLESSHPGRPISADLFGLTTTANDDLGIGQIWEHALPYFDYLAPMVYPSHYASGSFGIAKPAEQPYQIIKKAMEGAVKKTEAGGFSRDKIRPWLQDFNLGAIYGKNEVLDQLRAVYETGLDSWMMWDPANTYTYSAYQTKEFVLE